MKFKVLRNSETGLKISAIEKKADLAHEEAKKLVTELGGDKWAGAYWTAWGGISSISFDKEPDRKLWKVKDKGYYPKLNTKAGKSIEAKIDSLTRVSIDELNQSVGFDGAPFKTIGMRFKNETYYGFEVGDNWKFEAPEDCIEITTTEYNELFK